MPNQPSSSADPAEPTGATHVSGGIQATNSSLSAGADMVGRDKITQVEGDQVARDKVTYVGMSPEAVRRLVITVGVMVFVTAACFFAGGLIVGTSAINALQKPVASNLVAAAEFQQKLDNLKNLPDGTSGAFPFTELQFSSFIRFGLDSQIGLTNGKARFLDNNQVVFSGNWPGFLNLPIMIVCSVQANSDRIFKVESAAFNIFAGPDNIPGVGWLPLPTGTVQPLADRISSVLGQYFTVTGSQVVSTPNPSGPASPDVNVTIDIRTR